MAVKKEKKESHKDKKPERVVLFGEDVSEQQAERLHQKKEDGSVFGVALICAGILLLLNTLHIIPWTVWDHIWRFWPVLLIYWGVQVIFGINYVVRSFISLLGLILIVLIGLFAIYQVSPQMLSSLPPVIIQFFDSMKGWQR